MAKRKKNHDKTGNKPGIGYGKPPEGRKFERGNPGGPGRPAGESLTTKIRRILDEADDEYGTKADRLIAMAEKYASNGDFRFFKEIMDRMEGKVPDRIADADGEKLTIEVVYKDQQPVADD